MIGSQDTWVQMPTVDLYDTQMMLAAVNAARDMYNRNEQRIKEFNEKYGDFTTPIIADQDWYNREMLGKVYGTINDIYAKGGDPLRNSQDRLRVSMMLNRLPYGEYARKKLRSENAKEWFKNMAILNAKGKYDKDFSNFLGENPNQWALNDPGTTSPTEFQTLKEATNEWYNNRTPRSATAEEKQRLGLDPNYDYTLFTDDDLMNIARDQTPGWNNSAISKYYRDLAKKQVASRGIPYTQEDVERQLQRNIASAQQEWKVDPIKGHADQFALADYNFKKQLALQNDAQAFQKEMAEQAAKDKLDQIRARYGNKTINGGKDNPGNQNYSLTESLHHDLLFQGIRNNNIPVMKLTKDAKGNVVPEKDKNGKIVYINPDQASWNELEYAANSSNIYLRRQQDFFNTNSTKYASNPERVERMMKDRFGSRITGIQLASMLKRQIQRDGGIVLSSGEAKLLRGTKGITSDGIGSNYNLTHNDRLAEIYDQIKDAKDKEGMVGDIQIKFNLTDTGNNAVQIAEKFNKGRTEVYANGTVTVTGKNKEGKPITKEITTNAWLPLGLNSEIAAGNHTNVKSNIALASNNQSAYGSIDANYMKAMGQQQKANVGLFANSELPTVMDWDNLDIEDYLEFLQNNNP